VEIEIADGGKVTLTIHYQGEIFFSEHPFKNVTRLNGKVKSYGYATLDGCRYKNVSSSSSGQSLYQVSVSQLLCGVALNTEEQLLFGSLRFTMENLEDWVGRVNIEKAYDNLGLSSINLITRETIRFVLNDDWSLEISFRISTQSANKYQATVKQHTVFKLCATDARELEHFRKIALNITRFVCFGFGDIHCMKDLYVTSPDFTRKSESGKESHIDLKLYYESLPFIKTAEIRKRHNYVFNFEEIQENFVEYLNGWFRVCENCKPAIWLYFSYYSSSFAHLGGEFLALIRGLETLGKEGVDPKAFSEEEYSQIKSTLIQVCPDDKKAWLKETLHYANTPNLRTKLEHLVEPFKQLFGEEEEIKKMLTTMVSTRNYNTHFDDKLKAKASRGAELYRLILRAEILFQATFLTRMGMNSEQAYELLKSNPKVQRMLDY
jgi:hypothetical protein